MSKKIKHLQLRGLFFIASSAAGWYGYYLPKQDSLMIHWIILLVVGSLIYGYKNNILYKFIGKKAVFTIISDIFISILCWLLPKIKIQYGLSIIMMIIVVVILQFLVLKFYTIPVIEEQTNQSL